MATESNSSLSVSPKPSLSNQPTPFSIEDILSRSKKNLQQPEIHHSISNDFHDNSIPSDNNQDKIYDRNSYGSIEHDTKSSKKVIYPREQSSPECRVSVVRELDILRRNLAQANLTNFGTIPKTNYDNFDNLTGITNYRKIKDTNNRQQDEALDMSKNKYLGNYFIDNYINRIIFTSFLFFFLN